MATLSEVQAAQAAALTRAYKAQQNREAAKIAALIALYYQRRVDPRDPGAVDRWLELMVPRLVASSDSGARTSAVFFDALHRLEVGSPAAAVPSLGAINEGVAKSLLTVGPYGYMNKMIEIKEKDLGPAREKALLAEAKQVTATKVAAATLRHAQAGSRQTIYDNSATIETALGWIRVTKADPCFFCAMLASRGVSYRSFDEFSFDLSDSRFNGDGDAKVHDNCGCSLKPVFSENDPVAKNNERFGELWATWGAGGGNAVLRFRRGYEHLVKTGDYLTFDEANKDL